MVLKIQLQCDIPQDARGHVASAANRDHEIGLEVIEDLLCRLLAVLVDLRENPTCQLLFGDRMRPGRKSCMVVGFKGGKVGSYYSRRVLLCSAWA